MPPDFTSKLRQLLLRSLDDPFWELTMLGLVVFMMLAADFVLEYLELPLPLVVIVMCAALGAIILTERQTALLPRIFSWALSTFILFNQVIGIAHTSHKLADMDRMESGSRDASRWIINEAHAAPARPSSPSASAVNEAHRTPGNSSANKSPHTSPGESSKHPTKKGFFKTW